MKEMRNIEIQKGNLERGVGMQNDIDSMNEQNRAVEHELQQRRGTSASGQELMDEISKENIGFNCKNRENAEKTNKK